MSAYKSKYAGPIRVSAPPGRHLLTGAMDRRLVALPLDAAPQADIIIVPLARQDALHQAAEELSEEALRSVVAGQATLVLDHSSEGLPFSVKTSRQVEHFLKERQIPARHTVFLTQNRDHEKFYGAFARAAKVEPYTVLNYDLYIRNFFRDHIENGEETFAGRLRTFNARETVRDKCFLCLNFSLRPTKLLFLLKLLQGGLFDRGYISFPGFDAAKNVRALKKSGATYDLFAIPGLEDLGVELSPLMDELERRGGAVFGELKTASGMPNHFKSPAGDMALEEYDRSWFTVITETEMHGSRRITEKPLKALANFSPLIVLGNAFSLQMIRDFGFRTFDGWFDESYDEERDPRRRFQMVFEEVRRICALSEDRRRQMERAFADTIEFNARHALVEMPRRYRDELEPQLIDRLLDRRLTAG